MSAGWATVGWLAGRGGTTDRVRIALTAVGAALATLALLAAATVIAIDPDDGPYRPEVLAQPGLHVGVVTALLLLCVPVLGFTGQCARVGAPARDRRLAAIRLAGATPREARTVASLESGLAAGLGSVAGAGLYFLARALLADPVTGMFTRTQYVDGGAGMLTETYAGTGLLLPTDVLPPVWTLALLVLAVPVAAAVSSALALRRVAIGPLGVIRRRTRRPPRLLPAVLFIGGVAGLALFSSVVQVFGAGDRPSLLGLLFFVLLLLVLIGLLAGSATLAALVGTFIARRTGSPSLLIAARRLVADPYAASRAFGVLLVAVVFAAGAQAYRAFLLTVTSPYENPFYRQTMDLVQLVILVAIALACLGLLVAAAEGVVTRRRTLAALTAAGTPTRTLRRAVLVESLLPLFVAGPLAAVAGVLTVRGVVGTTTGDYLGGRMEPIPVPWGGTALVVVITLAVALLAVSASLAFLRASTDIVELRTG